MKPYYWAQIIAAALGLGAVTGAAGQADDELAKVTVLAHEANLEAFPFYKCRYTVTRANAASRAEALRGEYTDVRRYDCLLVVDGGKEKFESLTPPAPIKAPVVKPGQKPGPVYIPADWMAFGLLRNGDESLNYCPSLEAANLFPKGSPPNLPDFHPLAMGVLGLRREFGPTSRLKLCESGDASLKKAARAEMDGRTVVEVAFAQKERPDREYVFDVQQGYLLKEVIGYVPQYPGQDAIHAYLLEAKEFNGRRWFPMHVVRLTTPWKSPVDVVDIRVTELEVDKRPSKDDLRLTLPARTQVTNITEASTRPMYLKQPETVAPEDIPRLLQMLEDSKTNPLMDTRVRPRGVPFSSYLYAAGSIAFVGLGIVLWRRQGRKLRGERTTP